MKKKKIFNLFLFMISILFIGNMMVKADFTIGDESSFEYHDGSGIGIPIKIGYSSEHGNTRNAYCISGLNIEAPSSKTCTLNNSLVSEDNRIRIAYIIEKLDTTVQKNYIVTELAIESLLGHDLTGINQSYQDEARQLITGTQSISNEAIAIKNNKFAVKFYDIETDSVINSLSFYTEGEYYRTKSIKATGGKYTATDMKTITPAVTGITGAEVVGNASSFYVRIKKDFVSSGGTITVSVNNIKEKEYYSSPMYDCPNAQDVTVSGLKYQEAASASISGSISTKAKITIKKVDQNEEPLAGIVIKVENEDKSYNRNFTTDSTGQIVLDNLEFGKYTITEVSAPKQYVIADPKEITLSEDSTEATVIIKNELTKTVISKISAVNSKELPGAKLQILNSEQKNFSCTIIDSNGKEKELKECTWISGEKPVTVLGLIPGKYYLVETLAPEGYVLNSNKVEFEVKTDGSVTKVEMKNELEVKVPDTLSSRSTLLIAISMFDIALGIGILTYVKKNKTQE